MAKMLIIVVLALGLMLPGLSSKVKKGDGFDGFGTPDPFNQNDDDQVDAGEPNAPATENPNDDANMVSDDDDGDDDSFVQVASKTAARTRVFLPETDDEQFELDAKDGNRLGEQTSLRMKIPKVGNAAHTLSGLSLSKRVWPWQQHNLVQQPVALSGAQDLQNVLSAPAPAPAVEQVKTDATHAREAATVAKQAAKVANKVAEHSMKITGHAKKALKHALGALHDARVETTGLGESQKVSLKKAEAHLREAAKSANFGKLKQIKDAQDVQKEQMQGDLDNMKSGRTEEEDLHQQIEELRQKLKEKNVDDKDINKALDELQANHDGSSNDEVKAEIERLRELIDKLEEPKDAHDGQPLEGKANKNQDKKEKNLDVKPLHGREKSGHAASQIGKTVTPIEGKGIDIDTQMPFGDLEPFGREDTAQELTESSIKESDQMVDQLERAEVAEEKRSVFRSLTRLRGAAITSFDGVARSQSGNIDEYNKINKWRKSHPVHHLADEESDVTKWAFPDNAD